MSWVLLILVAWLALSLPVAMLIVRAIHQADAAARPARGEQRVLHPAVWSSRPRH